MITKERQQEITDDAMSAIRGSAITMRTFGHNYTIEEMEYGCAIKDK